MEPFDLNLAEVENHLHSALNLLKEFNEVLAEQQFNQNNLFQEEKG